MKTKLNLIALCLAGLAGLAHAQNTPTTEADVSQESVKGAGAVFKAAEKMRETTGRMNAAMLKRRDACVALAREGKLGDGPKGNGAMAQYKCLVAGTGAMHSTTAASEVK